MTDPNAAAFVAYENPCLCCGERGSLLCDTCRSKGCSFGRERCSASLLRAIAERRDDAEFMARLRERMERDAPLMERLKDGECNQPLHLVESRDGGAVLLYECPVCGGKVARTREQAEADKQASGSEVSPS